MRVVSLCPSTTKLIFDLGAGEDLVAVTKYCVHPVEGVHNLPRVGGTKDPDIDAILKLEPDLVLMNREENRREDFEALQAGGVCCHDSFPITLDETEASVLDIGEALGRGGESQAFVERIQAARQAVRRGKRMLAGVRWAYLIWRKPYMAISSNCYIHELISEAGGHNVFSAWETTYPEISVQALRSAEPHLVMLSSEPFPFKEKHIVELSEATGLAPGRFRLVDGERLSWHGSFTVSGLRYAASLLREAPL